MLEISFIIPCKNEEIHINTCINSIINQNENIIKYEIIIVDNGSTDKTIEIINAFKEDVKLFICPNLTIGGLRNFGVQKSKYEWIAFVDADVEIDKYWGENLNSFVIYLENNRIDKNNIITGSTCLVPEKSTWIERIWYQQIIRRDIQNIKYINSGHMVIHKEIFNKIGGFKSNYITGEEERLCKDAVSLNGKIIKNEKIKAIHHGYPREIKTFFNRMRWHGLGMKEYMKSPWKSKAFLLAIYNISLTILFICMIIMYNHFFLISTIYVLFQFLPVSILAYRRYIGSRKDIFLLTLLYVIYGWAKVVSLFDILSKNIEGTGDAVQGR